MSLCDRLLHSFSPVDDHACGTDTSKCIEMEEILAEQRSRNRLIELFTIKRNLRAVRASAIVMFAQQFCGINAIAYCESRAGRQCLSRGWRDHGFFP